MHQLFLSSEVHRLALHYGRLATYHLVTAAILTFALPSQPAQAARMADRIVAIVNHDVITLSDMKAEVRGEETSLRRQYQGTELDRRLRQLRYRVLTRLIERRLQIQVAKERGHVVTDEEVTEAMREFERRGEQMDHSDPHLMKMVREQLTVLRVMEREVRSGIMVSDDELKRYYENHLSRFMLPEEYRLSQILIRPRPGETAQTMQARAADVHTTLRQGAEFADLARRRSEGAEAGQGGSLGFVRQGELESSIEHAIARLQPGEFSEPIKTENGFHIVRLDDRKPSRFREYTQVKAELQTLVYQQKTEDHYAKWMGELKDKAYIEVKF